ncbi:unnamed protein product [Urochloa decumbens]|uniref:Uncharacterized protein n=1 Tax=Urochloa decumbens TaxID=240449 RepID=A0ABC9B0K8_9POAL
MERASLVGGTMASLAVKLNSILMPKYELMAGARADVLFLHAELESMHAFLEKLSMARDPDAQVKAWTKEVRELAYDTEDAMDEFMRRVDASHGAAAPNHGLGTLRGLASRAKRLASTVWTHLRLANELKVLKARAVEVSERRSRYKYGEDIWGSRDHIATDPRINVLYADVPDLIGIDVPMSEVLEWLIGGATTLKVMSIAGFGGLGKTTLAMEVFRRVGGQFTCRAFAAVSQKLDMTKLLKDLLSQVAQGEADGMDTWEEGQLIRKLRECLLNRRYLIIIDDVWSKSAWEKVRCALPENNHNSRILTTTRIESVAKSCCPDPDDRIYRIEPLNESDSKVLFFKRIFGDKEGCPPQLFEVSNQILKKCCGSPLAIISIASLLASKPVMLKEQWEKLLISIGSALEKNPDLEGMKQILSLSYYDLPYHLKICLLYLSIYPEDFKIERDSLIQQWIAEGFVGRERGLSVEEVAEGYFNELINRSMVQPMDINCDGRAHACRVHDVMLELIISKAIEENFVTLIGSHPVPTLFVQGNVRRLSIQCDSEISKLQGEMNLNHARTLTSFVQATLVPSLSEFRVLRVLNLEGCQGFSENHLKDINCLFHLKYLSLRRTWISNLPPQIGDLQTLETLDIRETNIEELPGMITGLVQLKYILSGGHTWGKIKLPDGIGSMTSLKAILGFDICRSSASAVRELGNLKSLMELAINWTDFTSGNVKHQEALMRTLGKLGTSNLQSFAVCSRNFGSLEFLDSWSPPPNHLQKFRLSAYYFLPRVPRWMGSVCNLIDLNINIAELTDEDMLILRELPSLLRLDLWLKSPQKDDRIVVNGVGFPYLKELFFSCEETCLIFEPAALPKLERLHTTVHAIRAKPYCHHFGIEHLKSLKQINIQVFCYGTSVSDIKDVELAISTAVKYHPNHPRIYIEKRGMDSNLEETKKREHSDDKNVEDHVSKEDINRTNNKRRKLQIEEHHPSSVQ